MGYTHYWYRKEELDEKKFSQIRIDFLKVKGILEEHYKVNLAGPNGEGDPVISKDEIMFNGDAKCGHPEQSLGITWPSEHASGVANQYTENVKDGKWFAGAQLSQRTCGGDCSHEGAILRRVFKKLSYSQTNDDGLHFSFCKTAFKPYDLAVLCLLIIAKHRLGDDISVSSDGTDAQWYDGKYVCHMMLGYGFEYCIDEKEGKLVKREVKSNDKI